MANKRLQLTVFLLLLLAVLVLVIYIVKPFINVIIFATILAILFQPVHAYLGRRTRSSSLGALLTILLLALIVLIPLLFFGGILRREAMVFYNRLSTGQLVLHGDQLTANVPPQLRNVVELFSNNLNSFMTGITGNAFHSLANIFSNIVGFLISLIIFFITLFYLLRDGDRIKTILNDLLPIAAKQENEFIDKIVFSVNAVVKGSLLTALVHAASATIGFFLFGIPEFAVWGLFMLIAALVPMFGTLLTMSGAIIYLLITGQTVHALELAIWTAITVPLIDNLIAPRLVSSKVHLHPLLVVFGIVGGLRFFGLLGFLIGLIVMSALVALIEIYRRDYKPFFE